MLKPRKPLPTSRRNERAKSHLRPTSEKALVKRIIRQLRKAPDAWVKKRRGDMAGSGEPDIERIRLGHVTMLEVKLPGLDATPLQRRVMVQLLRAGATVAVVHSVEEALDAAARGDSDASEEIIP